jgi:hypothetical protein
MISLLFQFGPWIAGALGLLAGFLLHLNAQSKVAQANQKVSEAQTVAAQAQTQAAQTQDAAAQANATAAQAGAQALKERENVETTIAAQPVGSAAEQLRNNGWTRD